MAVGMIEECNQANKMLAMKNKLIAKGISCKLTKEDLSLDLYVYNTMLALGYDIYSFGRDEERDKYANEVIRYLVNGEDIPDSIKDYLLKSL